jgi:hypothetical protein
MIHKINNSIWNKEKLPQQWKESLIVPISKKIDKLSVIFIDDITATECKQNVAQYSSFKFNFMRR